MERRFQQVDVFGTSPHSGNPLAVVIDGEGLSSEQMQRFANWTNLSETTFLLPPTDPAADYRLRIFTTTWELPFAGHPTLGSCQVWLDQGGVPRRAGEVVQQCGIGSVRVRRNDDRLAFAAPPLLRSGPVDDDLRARIERTLGTEVLDVAWVDNGPGWVAALLPSADHVLDLRPDFGGTLDLKLGVVGPADPDEGYDVEVRAFFPGPASMEEDPVTGSLNASLAQWLMERDPSLHSYTAQQGTVLGRNGLVHLHRDDTDTIWVGGQVTTSIHGTLTL